LQGNKTQGKITDSSALKSRLCACGAAAGRDGFCGSCRLRKLTAARQRPPLPPNILEELRLAYIGNVRRTSENLNRLAARAGVPKQRLKDEAGKRGWRSQTERRPWSAAEVEFLEENLGKLSSTQIARKLGRGVASVQLRARKLQRSLRVTEGYNVSDLAEVFGVSHGRVESWARRGLLGRATGHGGHGGNLRFATQCVLRFVRKHASEYDLNRVDQEWFKAILFGFRALDGQSR